MAFPLQRTFHLKTIRRCCKYYRPAVLLSPSWETTPPPPPPSLTHTRRDFTQYTYDTFFASQPLDPTIWNSAIWCAEYYLSALHDYAGLSWGWSVVLGTIFLRTAVTLPLLIYGEINQDRLERLRQDVEDRGLRKQLTAEVHHLAKIHTAALPDKKAIERFLNLERKVLMRKEYQKWNCHPGKMFALPVVQIPLWFASSIALRNMCGEYVIEGEKMSPTRPDLADEPFLWIADLTLPDASLAISFLIGLTFLVLTEINVYKQFNGQPMGRRGMIITNLLRGVSVIVMPTFAYLVPATVSLYWLSSGVIGLTHNIVAMMPTVRRFFGITLRASPYDTPGRTIWRGFKGYWKL